MKRLPVLNRDTLAPVIESILFVTEEPVEISTLVRTLQHSAPRWKTPWRS